MRRLFSPPNQLTFLRILLTPVFVAMFLSREPHLRQWSIVVFIVAMATDWYDGWVARRWGYVTRWGSFLDPFADKVFISSAFITFVILDLVPAWAVWIIIVRDIGITFLRSYSELKGRPFITSQFAKTKTFLQFAILYYLLLLHVAQTSFAADHPWQSTITVLLHRSVVDPLMACIALLTLLTGVFYLFTNRSTLRAFSGVSD